MNSNIFISNREIQEHKIYFRINLFELRNN